MVAIAPDAILPLLCAPRRWREIGDADLRCPGRCRYGMMARHAGDAEHEQDHGARQRRDRLVMGAGSQPARCEAGLIAPRFEAKAVPASFKDVELGPRADLSPCSVEQDGIVRLILVVGRAGDEGGGSVGGDSPGEKITTPEHVYSSQPPLGGTDYRIIGIAT